MTEENQKRRKFLSEIESIVRETLASQPLEDDGDCVKCGMALDRGLVRIDEVVRKYKAEWPEHWGEPSDRPPVVDTRRTPSWMMSGRHG